MVNKKRFIMVLLNGFMNVRYTFICYNRGKNDFFSSLNLDEIFNRNILLYWSPTDRYLAYIKTNLTNLSKNHYLKYDFNDENNEKYSIPYPKYNDTLPILDVYIYNIRTGKTIRVPRPFEYDKV